MGKWNCWKRPFPEKAQKFLEMAGSDFYAFTQVFHKFRFDFSQNTFCELHHFGEKQINFLQRTDKYPPRQPLVGQVACSRCQIRPAVPADTQGRDQA